MSAVNTSGAQAANAVLCAAAYRAVPAERRMIQAQANTSNEWMAGWMEHTVHGLQMQSHDAAAYKAVPAERVRILAHMVMTGGKSKTEGLAGMGSRERQADKAWQGKTRLL